MRVVLDIETDSLKATKIWCIVCREFPSGEVHVFRNCHLAGPDRDKFIEYSGGITCFIGHNLLGFDLPTLIRFGLLPSSSVDRVIDTLVIARLLDYGIVGGNSLDAWGERLGTKKSYFKDFSQLTQEMVDYCVQDTAVSFQLYRRFLPTIRDPKMKKALRVEHEMQLICNDMEEQGFGFDFETCSGIFNELEEEKAEIENEFQDLFPPKLIEVKRLKNKKLKSGEDNRHVVEAKKKHASWYNDGEELVCMDYVPFDPASPKDRIDRMWEAGWKPTERTKGHNLFLKEKMRGEPVSQEKEEKFATYGWTMSEVNVATLPSNAPEGARKLAKWVTLQGRILIIRQWLDAYNPETKRIHGRFNPIGSWTGRMSHVNPNSANIFSPFHGEPRSPVEEVKAKVDGRARACWNVPEGSFLVGTDAEGIQLRILAHTLKNEEYAEAIANGRKEDQSDIHNVNRRALGDVCRDRDTAKTFIYAFLLGAGNEKVAQILGCSIREAKAAVENFMKNIGGLYDLKKKIIPTMARRGGFWGVDGRFVKCTSEHLMLAGILQNGESCVMKHSNVLWRKEAKEAGIRFKQVGFIHDEWQVEVFSREDAEKLGAIQRSAIERVGIDLGIMCPLAGTTDIGFNWAETH